MATKDKRSDIPVRIFRTNADWEAWLAKNHSASQGLWLKLAKKGSGRKSVTYDEAVETALCFGWIDGQKKPFNERKKSILKVLEQRDDRLRTGPVRVENLCPFDSRQMLLGFPTHETKHHTIFAFPESPTLSGIPDQTS
jgi:uncharacterized protein YdeI (YjbR/CyaY-like superfamily)